MDSWHKFPVETRLEALTTLFLFFFFDIRLSTYSDKSGYAALSNRRDRLEGIIFSFTTYATKNIYSEIEYNSRKVVTSVRFSYINDSAEKISLTNRFYRMAKVPVRQSDLEQPGRWFGLYTSRFRPPRGRVSVCFCPVSSNDRVFPGGKFTRPN